MYFGSKKLIILGCCSTGAKYTPRNHKLKGDRIIDAISTGDLIHVSNDKIREEISNLHDLGCRYYHIHARNPSTKEQCCVDDIYAEYGRITTDACKDMLLSYGASRNGLEIIDSIRSDGEWSRISHVSLPLERGGAHFITAQAAVELQIVCDLERQGYVEFDHVNGTFTVLKPLDDYIPDDRSRPVKLEVNSTDNGSNYGQSSARIQYDVMQQTIRERIRLGLPFEVEWVQNARSCFLTWFLVNHFPISIVETRRLNITLLFGFSPRLPVPENYAAFKRIVDQAKNVAREHPKGDELRVSVTVGAAVIPQHAALYRQRLDVGVKKGQVVSAFERIITYASQPDSGVDVVRVGMEDTPYLEDRMGVMFPVTNVELVEHAARVVALNEAHILTDDHVVSDFLKAETTDNTSAVDQFEIDRVA